MRLLLIADDASWSRDDQAWLAALMAGKESRVVGSSSSDKGANYQAFWAAASMLLTEPELNGPFDLRVLAPCLEQLRNGTMAGFKSIASCLGGQIGEGAGAPFISGTATRPLHELLGKTLSNAPHEQEPISTLLLVRVLPPPADARSIRAAANSFGSFKSVVARRRSSESVDPDPEKVHAAMRPPNPPLTEALPAQSARDQPTPAVIRPS